MMIYCAHQQTFCNIKECFTLAKELSILPKKFLRAYVIGRLAQHPHKKGGLHLMRKCLKIRVLGNVQTAAYRMHVQKSAADLGIEGTLQNAPDGNVIVYACAPADVLDVFIDALYANTK